MKMLAANYIAYCQLKWASQEKIRLEGSTKRLEDNLLTMNSNLKPKGST